MDLADTLNATGVASLKSQLGTVPASGNWSTLTAQGVWEYATRVLTAATNLSIPSASDVATAVWGAGVRTLTSLGSVVADTAAAVWGATTRALTDKAGFAPAMVTAGEIRTAVGLGAANLDTQLGDLPTNAELGTALGGLTVTVDVAAIATAAAAAILATPSRKLATNADGSVNALATISEEVLAAAIAVALIEAGLAASPDSVTWQSELFQDDDLHPLDGLEVILCTDEAGTIPRFIGRTNASGRATIQGVDTGTYWQIGTLAGYPTSVKQITVEAPQ